MADRLTRRDEYGFAELINKNGKSFDLSSDIAYAMCPDDEFLDIIQDVISKIAHYEDLDEKSRLIELPCAVGDIVYYPEKDYNFVFPVKISEIILSDLGNNEKCFQFNGAFFNGNGDLHTEFEFDYEDFGKTVFTTEEEALAKLAKMQSKDTI